MAKFLVASDIHGSLISFNRVMELFNEHKADKLILLGDVFGAYADEMVEALNGIANRVTIIKGNNDWYFEPENAKFKLFEHTYENINGKVAYLSHGHKLNDSNLAEYGAKIVMFGHFHRPILRKENDIVIFSPGSIAKPRMGADKCYGIIDDKKIQIFNDNDELYDELEY